MRAPSYHFAALQLPISFNNTLGQRGDPRIPDIRSSKDQNICITVNSLAWKLDQSLCYRIRNLCFVSTWVAEWIIKGSRYSNKGSFSFDCIRGHFQLLEDRWVQSSLFSCLIQKISCRIQWIRKLYEYNNND